MQAGRQVVGQQPNLRFVYPNRSQCQRTKLHYVQRTWHRAGVVSPGFVPRAGSGQKDVTAELLERAFSLTLQTRLKQHGGINVDVRSTAWGLLEGKFGGMTVRGTRWRTPLELTAEQLMVDVGEMVLDYQKLMWQQTVALKNVPQGAVSFTLTSQDLANFMVHPIMVEAASRAVKGHAFIFDRSTASVRQDPATGRGIITYEGVWAGNGQRYAVAMSTPGGQRALAAAAPRPLAPASFSGPTAASSSLLASSNTLDQLSVFARRVRPPGGSPPGAARSTTGSFASMGSFDEAAAAPTSAAVAAAAASAVAGAAAVVGAAAVAAPSAARRVATLTMPAPGGAALSLASAGSSLDDSVAWEEGADESEAVVGEGLRRFFSSLTLNLQGIELRQPVLLVQLPGPGVGAAAAGGRAQPLPRSPAAAAAPTSPPPPSAPAPALLTITMKVAILQLPPLDMKF